MTKKEYFEMIMTTVKGHENEQKIVEFCEKEILNLDKKLASNEKRQANKEKEYAELEKQILTLFKSAKLLTPKEIGIELGLNPQKVSPRLQELAKKGILKRKQDKKVIFYMLAE